VKYLWFVIALAFDDTVFFAITVLNVLSAQNKYAILDYYTCKLVVCTVESIVLRLRKTGFQKEPGLKMVLETPSTIIRWTDRSRVPKWLRHFSPRSLRTFKKDRSDQTPKWSRTEVDVIRNWYMPKLYTKAVTSRIIILKHYIAYLNRYLFIAWFAWLCYSFISNFTLFTVHWLHFNCKEYVNCVVHQCP